MIIRWGRKGLIAGAIAVTFVTASANSIHRVSVQPGYKTEVRHVTPESAVTKSIKRYQILADNRFEFRYLTPAVIEEQRGGGGKKKRKKEIIRYKRHEEQLSALIERRYGIEVTEIVEKAEKEGISLADEKVRRLAQAIHERPYEFEQLIKEADEDDDALALILILMAI